MRRNMPILLVIAILTAFFAASFATSSSGRDRLAQDCVNPMETAQMRIIDERGKPILVISALADGWPGVGLAYADDSRGFGSIVIAPDRSIGMKFDGGSQSSAFLLLGHDGNASLLIEGGGKNRGKVNLGVDADGVPYIKLIDGDGNIVWAR